MARIIHAEDNAILEGICPDQMCKLITYGEPGHPSDTLTVRYTSLGSGAMICAFIMRGKCRYGLRVLTLEERAAYIQDRLSVMDLPLATLSL